MVLAINIENSVISIGGVEGGKILFAGSIAADLNRTTLDYVLNLKTVLEAYGVQKEAITGSIIASVVPQLTGRLREAVHFLTGKMAKTVGPGLKTGLSILMDNPAQLGSDLVALSVAAADVCEGPAVVVSLGTAITYCVLNEKKQYMGSIIAPGVRVALEGLTGRAAQLSSISLEAPKRLIGTNTQDCLKSGVIYGAAAGIDGMLDRIEEALGTPVQTVAAGMDAGLIIPHCRREIRLEEHLLLKGLWIIYNRNKKE